MNREDFEEFVNCPVKVTYQSHVQQVTRRGVLVRINFQSLTLLGKTSGYYYHIPIKSVVGVVRGD